MHIHSVTPIKTFSLNTRTSFTIAAHIRRLDVYMEDFGHTLWCGEQDAVGDQRRKLKSELQKARWNEQRALVQSPQPPAPAVGLEAVEGVLHMSSQPVPAPENTVTIGSTDEALAYLKAEFGDTAVNTLCGLIAEKAPVTTFRNGSILRVCARRHSLGATYEDLTAYIGHFETPRQPKVAQARQS